MPRSLDAKFEEKLGDVLRKDDLALYQQFATAVMASTLPPRRKEFFKQQIDRARSLREKREVAKLRQFQLPCATAASNLTLAEPSATASRVTEEKSGDSDTDEAIAIRRSEPRPDDWESQSVVTVTDLPTRSNFVLDNKASKTIIVLCHLATARFRNLKHCDIYLPSVASSVNVDNCQECRFFAVARQLRVHDTTDSEFGVAIKTSPILEQCRHLKFSKWRITGDTEGENIRRIGGTDSSWTSLPVVFSGDPEEEEEAEVFEMATVPIVTFESLRCPPSARS